jgi:hypothetical protein
MAKSRKRKPRDYKAEYARRIARAAKQGIPRNVARGHARKGTAGIKLAKILGIPVGSAVADRPRVARPSPDYVGPTFEERLEAAGFGSFLVEQRRRVLRRDTDLDGRAIKRVSTRQEEFVQVIMEAVHTEREAYTQWFSPK